MSGSNHYCRNVMLYHLIIGIIFGTLKIAFALPIESASTPQTNIASNRSVLHLQFSRLFDSNIQHENLNQHDTTVDPSLSPRGDQEISGTSNKNNREVHDRSYPSQPSYVKPLAKPNLTKDVRPEFNSVPGPSSRFAESRLDNISPQDETDGTIEGSGVGPSKNKNKHKNKYDDTEDTVGDDDEEDEDQDYGDYNASEPDSENKSKKPAVETTNHVKESSAKPSDQNIYNPFRPPTTLIVNHTKPLIGKYQENTPAAKQVTPSGLLHTKISTTTAAPVQSSPSASTSNPMSTKTPYMSNQDKNGRSKNESDYDYEDESDDDDSEEASAFEDNDPNDLDSLAPNKTISESTTPTIVHVGYSPKQQSSRHNLNMNTNFSRPTETNKNDNNRNSTNHYNNQVINPSESSKPVTIADDQDEDTDASYGGADEEDEEDEDEEEEFDDEDTSQSNMPQSSSGVDKKQVENKEAEDRTRRPQIQISTQPPISDSSSPGHSIEELVPAVSTFSTGRIINHSHNRPLNSEKSTTLDTTVEQDFTTLTPILTKRPQSTAQDSRELITGPPRIQYKPSTINPSTSTFTPLNNYQSTSQPSVLGAWPSTARPIYPPQLGADRPSNRVNYATTPRTEIKTENSINLLTNNRDIIVMNDDGLTRQIYDKTLEVYQETERTLKKAWEVIWPTNMNFESPTLEPLLQQPMYFMFALAGAVIGIVLLMMLVVYIITYQIQPRDHYDDISLY